MFKNKLKLKHAKDIAAISSPNYINAVSNKLRTPAIYNLGTLNEERRLSNLMEGYADITKNIENDELPLNYKAVMRQMASQLMNDQESFNSGMQSLSIHMQLYFKSI